MKKLIITCLLAFTLCGCSNTVKQQEVVETKKPATEMKPTALLNGHTLNIPDGYIVEHSPITVVCNGTEREVVSFTADGKYDGCCIRYASTTVPIDNIEKADKVLREFNTAFVYNADPSNTVANEIKLLNDEKVYLLQAIAMDNSGYSYFINSFIEKGTCDLYSMCVLYKPDMTSDCSEELLASVYSDISNIIFGTSEFDDRFRIYAKSTIDAWNSTKKLDGASTIEHVTEVTERELIPGVSYVLEEDNNVFTFEAVEGAGKIILNDERFGERELLVGYGSINAPPLHENVALVHNESILIEGDVAVNLMRKKWKEN